MNYQDHTVMNFLKSTAAKGRSSAANTHHKNESQFDHMDYDNINQNLFATFQPQPYKQNQQTPIQLYNPNESNYTNQNNSYSYNQYPSGQTHKMVENTNNFSYFNSNNMNLYSNNVDNNSLKISSYNNPEINGKKTFSFTKDNYEVSSSFSSARVETTELLQTLSLKLNNQISKIDSKIHNFYRNMDGKIQQFFKIVKRQIYEMVEEALIAGMRQAQQYKKMQEQHFIGELYKVKDMLQKEHAKIQVMKSDMNSNQWKKTTGDIISNDIQQKIYDTIRRSSTIQPRRWEPPNVIPQLKQVQKNLINVLSLR